MSGLGGGVEGNFFYCVFVTMELQNNVICLCISPKVSLPVPELWVPLKREVQIYALFYISLVHHVYCTLVCETVLDVDQSILNSF